MRTTVTIDDDVLAAARQIADSDGRSLGQALSDLARSGLDKRPGEVLIRNGIRLLPISDGARGASLAEVNRLRDEAG